MNIGDVLCTHLSPTCLQWAVPTCVRYHIFLQDQETARPDVEVSVVVVPHSERTLHIIVTQILCVFSEVSRKT
jgi:hypothetical protein